MPRLRVLGLLLFASLSCSVFGQAPAPALDYSRADSLALTVKYDGNLNILTRQLTTPFNDPFLKTRAIFRWITENIAYDCKYYNKYGYEGREPKTYKCGDDSTECDIRRQVWENTYISHVLDAKKGVCQGYAMLFKKMCNIVGIECVLVPGYVRTEYYEIGTPGNLDHAWNAVNLNGSFYLVDATWAAGGASKDDDGKLKEFVKHFSDYYWLTPPGDFGRNHFPEDAKWSLIKAFTKDKFALNPYYDPGHIASIQLMSPATGVIHVKQGDTLKFKVNYSGRLEKLQINTNIFQNPDIYTNHYITNRKYITILDTFAVKKQQYVTYKQTGDLYEFAYVVRNYTLEYLDIMFDRQRVLRFKVTYR